MINLLDCLDAIDPAQLDYQEWVNVGMALHHEGLSLDIWDNWSSRDAERYHKGECARKWAGFTANSGVTAGTIVHMARGFGWVYVDEGKSKALDWDTELIVSSDTEPVYCEPIDDDTDIQQYKIVDPSWLEIDYEEFYESEEKEENNAETWEGWRELVEYLEALFYPNDFVGYVSKARQIGEKWVPENRGYCSQTASELIASITKWKNNLDCSICWDNKEAGAWIRFNPLDGKGAKDENVVDYRFCLVECDEISIEKQIAIIKKLELPVAALVHSGNKSIHAIVHVDAKEYDEYRRRVDFIYKVCKENGLKLDTQNKNPSRLSRMPGISRGDNKQKLLDTHIGQADFVSWKTWLDEQNDEFPEPECLSDVWDTMPNLSEPLIDGVLRKGHKMLLAGPSKAGKSFSLINLCISIAEGLEWLGFECAQGRVMYINLELDRASCLHRFKDVYSALEIEPQNISNIDIWNLRGKAKPITELTPALIRRALKTRPIAVVIDPIYKIITGDENSADQMSVFCNQFDKIADSLECAVIYCHHHSKGYQIGKRAMDRASGSGVFARDPDALIDMVELHVNEDMRKAIELDSVKTHCIQFSQAQGYNIDTNTTTDNILAQTRNKAYLDGFETEFLNAIYQTRQKSKLKTAWRIEGTLREFPTFEPVNLWFDYPLHKDDENGILNDAQIEGEILSKDEYREQGREKKAANDKKRQEEKLQALREGMTACKANGLEPTIKNVVEYMPEVNGKAVNIGQVSQWVTKTKHPWCPVELKAEKGKAGILVDKKLEELIDDFENLDI